MCVGGGGDGAGGGKGGGQIDRGYRSIYTLPQNGMPWRLSDPWGTTPPYGDHHVPRIIHNIAVNEPRKASREWSFTLPH